MSDYLALIIVVGVVVLAAWITRWPVWHRCRCGRQYCIGCGKEK